MVAARRALWLLVVHALTVPLLISCGQKTEDAEADALPLPPTAIDDQALCRAFVADTESTEALGNILVRSQDLGAGWEDMGPGQQDDCDDLSIELLRCVGWSGFYDDVVADVRGSRLRVQSVQFGLEVDSTATQFRNSADARRYFISYQKNSLLCNKLGAERTTPEMFDPVIHVERLADDVGAGEQSFHDLIAVQMSTDLDDITQTREVIVFQRGDVICTVSAGAVVERVDRKLLVELAHTMADRLDA